MDERGVNNPAEDRQTDGRTERGVSEGREGKGRKRERNQKASQFRAQSSGSRSSGRSLTASTRDKNKPSSLSKTKKKKNLWQRPFKVQHLQGKQEVQQTPRSIFHFFIRVSGLAHLSVSVVKTIVGGTSCEKHANLLNSEMQDHICGTI